jgi:hypothetical protein
VIRPGTTVIQLGAFPKPEGVHHNALGAPPLHRQDGAVRMKDGQLESGLLHPVRRRSASGQRTMRSRRAILLQPARRPRYALRALPVPKGVTAIRNGNTATSGGNAAIQMGVTQTRSQRCKLVWATLPLGRESRHPDGSLGHLDGGRRHPDLSVSHLDGNPPRPNERIAHREESTAHPDGGLPHRDRTAFHQHL